MFFQNLGEVCHFYNKNFCIINTIIKMFKTGNRSNLKNYMKVFLLCVIYLNYQRTISKKATSIIFKNSLIH